MKTLNTVILCAALTGSALAQVNQDKSEWPTEYDPFSKYRDPAPTQPSAPPSSQPRAPSSSNSGVLEFKGLAYRFSSLTIK